MKTIEKMKVLIVSIALFCSLPGLSQKHESHEVVLHPDEYTGPIQISKEDFPKGNVEGKKNNAEDSKYKAKATAQVSCRNQRTTHS